MQYWEYKIAELNSFHMNAENKLNSLGQEGWELVCVLPENLHAIFKRPDTSYREPVDLDVFMREDD